LHRRDSSDGQLTKLFLKFPVYLAVVFNAAQHEKLYKQCSQCSMQADRKQIDWQNVWRMEIDEAERRAYSKIV